jgi:hypothetical protein
VLVRHPDLEATFAAVLFFGEFDSSYVLNRTSMALAGHLTSLACVPLQPPNAIAHGRGVGGCKLLDADIAHPTTDQCEQL